MPVKKSTLVQIDKKELAFLRKVEKMVSQESGTHVVVKRCVYEYLLNIEKAARALFETREKTKARTKSEKLLDGKVGR